MPFANTCSLGQIADIGERLRIDGAIPVQCDANADCAFSCGGAPHLALIQRHLSEVGETCLLQVNARLLLGLGTATVVDGVAPGFD